MNRWSTPAVTAALCRANHDVDVDGQSVVSFVDAEARAVASESTVRRSRRPATMVVAITDDDGGHHCDDGSRGWSPEVFGQLRTDEPRNHECDEPDADAGGVGRDSVRTGDHRYAVVNIW